MEKTWLVAAERDPEDPVLHLTGRGSFRISREIQSAVAPWCSFCGKQPFEVEGVTGVADRDHRICNECIELALDIISEELAGDRVQLRSDDPAVQKTWESVDEGDSKGQVFIERLLGELDREKPDPEGTRCGFCGAHRRIVDKMISVSNAYVCDRCAYVAAGLLKRPSLSNLFSGSMAESLELETEREG